MSSGTIDDLRGRYDQPRERALRKSLLQLDVHMRRFTNRLN